MTIRVVIADDHALLRQGIRNVLELEPELTVLGEAADGEEAVRGDPLQRDGRVAVEQPAG